MYLCVCIKFNKYVFQSVVVAGQETLFWDQMTYKICLDNLFIILFR